jgi:hypothetical protein
VDTLATDSTKSSEFLCLIRWWANQKHERYQKRYNTKWVLFHAKRGRNQSESNSPRRHSHASIIGYRVAPTAATDNVGEVHTSETFIAHSLNQKPDERNAAVDAITPTRFKSTPSRNETGAGTK